MLIRTALPSDRLIEPIRAVLAGTGRDRAFVRVATLREASVGPLARITWMAVSIAALVLSLAVVGLYGAISFVTAQRTREIAIRMAVGATAPAVLRLVVREGVLVLTAGSALGLVLMGVAFRFMSGMIFAAWTPGSGHDCRGACRLLTCNARRVLPPRAACDAPGSHEGAPERLRGGGIKPWRAG